MEVFLLWCLGFHGCFVGLLFHFLRYFFDFVVFDGGLNSLSCGWRVLSNDFLVVSEGLLLIVQFDVGFGSVYSGLHIFLQVNCLGEPGDCLLVVADQIETYPLVSLGKYLSWIIFQHLVAQPYNLIVLFV